MNREKQIEEMASLIYRCCNGVNFDDVSDAVVALQNAGYRKQSENVIELPCKVGQTVFFYTCVCDKEGEEKFDILEGEVISFSVQNEGLWSYCRYKCGLTYWHLVEQDFCKTVFLTKEEAEAKMKGGEDMREILFRGKRTDNGEWINGFYFQKQNPTTKDGTPIYHAISDLSPFGAEVIPDTVGQYTGLTDKNGKKIFEGDIVRLYYSDGFEEIGAIGWSNIDVRYKFASHDGFAYGIDVTDVFEVIGNIHDNPELLKGE